MLKITSSKERDQEPRACVGVVVLHFKQAGRQAGDRRGGQGRLPHGNSDKGMNVSQARFILPNKSWEPLRETARNSRNRDWVSRADA